MAAQVRQSKVLRIAIIQDRKIKQERLIKAGEPVLVGDDPKKNTFVVPTNAVTGASFALFEWSGSHYVLCFNNRFGEKSKVTRNGRPSKLDSLHDDPEVSHKGDLMTVTLSEQDRGRLELDTVTVLFQFVPPPPTKAVKPIMAMDFRPRLMEEDDPIFLGFLAIWSALALVLTIWVWSSEKPVYSLEELPDRFTKMVVAPPPEIEPPEITETEEIDPELESVDATKTETKPAPSQDEPEPASKGEQAKSIQDAKDTMMEQSKLLAKIIGTAGDSSAGTVADMWSDQDKGMVDIDKALAEKGGGITTDANDPGIREGVGGGTGEAATISGLKTSGGGGTSEVGGGPAVVVKGSVSTGNGTVSEEIGDSGKVKNTVRKYAGQMKYCYEQQLKKNSSLEGRVELGWYVDAGNVTDVFVVSNGTGDAELAKCMQAKLKRWKFTPDIQGDVQWPFVFRPKS